jgi:hypothetical protein
LLAPSPASAATNDKTIAGDAKPVARESTIFAFVEGNENRGAQGRGSATKGLFVMPIRQYFVWVGSALLVALFAADWWLPNPAAHSHPAIAPNERVNLRIRSDHKWPERVVFDTAHSGMQLAAESESKLDVFPNQDRAEPRSPLDAFAAMEAAPVTPTATNDKASPIRAKPRPLGIRMTSAAKAY